MMNCSSHLKGDRHTTESIKAVDGKTAVPPGTYKPTAEIPFAILLHLTPLKGGENSYMEEQ